MDQSEKPKDYAMRVVIAVLASLSVIGVVVGILVVKNLPSPSDRVVIPLSGPAVLKPEMDRSLEHKCAIINASGFVSESDKTVARFRSLLNELQRKTGYTQQQIADMNTYAVQTLRVQYGRNIKLLDFMEQTLKPLSAAKIDYKEVVAAMVVLIGKGRN